MKKRFMISIRVTLIVLISLSSFQLMAQKMTLGYIYPSGGERGTTTEILVGGLNVNNASGAIVSGAGVKVEVIAGEENKSNAKKKKGKRLDDQSSPQLADQVKLRITIDKDAEPGLRDLRLQSTTGVSNKLNFEVGQYPNLLENSNNQKSATKIEKYPVVLCGQVMPGEIDRYDFSAQKGLNLVAVVKARALIPYIADAVPGWFQSVISIKNSKGKEVAYCDDYRGNVDPVLFFTVPEDDNYTLEIRDAIYRGREDFTYRIDFGEIPYLKSIYPTVGRVGKKCDLILDGVNLKTNKMTYKVKSEGYQNIVALGKHGEQSNGIALWGSINLSAPSKHPIAKNVISNSSSCYDSISNKSRSISYSYEATANETATFEVLARRIGSLLDGRLRLYDSQGKMVAESDDKEDEMQGLMTFHADPELTYTFASAGTYTLVVEDVLDRRGRDYFFLLEKRLKSLPFQLFVSPATISIPKGGTAMFSVTVESKDKLAYPIEMALKGLPKGAKMSELKIPNGYKRRDITVTMPENSAEGKYELQLSAAMFDRKGQQESDWQNAVATDEMMQAFYYHHKISAASFSAEVTPLAPFILEFPEELKSDGQYRLFSEIGDTLLTIPVKIRRNGNFTDRVELSLFPKNKNLVLSNNIIESNETEKVVTVSIRTPQPMSRKKMRMSLSIVGTVNGEISKVGKRIVENAKYREMTPFIEIFYGK